MRTQLANELEKTFCKNTVEERINILAKEIDHQLLLLHNSIQLKDNKKINEIKTKLTALSNEKIKLER